MNKKFFFILLVLVTLISCKSENEKILIGTWTVDVAYSIEENAEMFFRANLITFKKNGTCSLPRFDKNQNSVGSWHIDKEKNDSLKILINDNPLGGTYKFDFSLDKENKLLKLNLTSDSYRLRCSKFLHSYDENLNIE